MGWDLLVPFWMWLRGSAAAGATDDPFHKAAGFPPGSSGRWFLFCPALKGWFSHQRSFWANTGFPSILSLSQTHRHNLFFQDWLLWFLAASWVSQSSGRAKSCLLCASIWDDSHPRHRSFLWGTAAKRWYLRARAHSHPCCSASILI